MAKTVRDYYGLCSTVPLKAAFTAGVELEIEDVRDLKAGVTSGWNMVKDGSLRNNGQEFISPPLPLSLLVDGFKGIHATIVHSPTPAPFSERTSIHAHVNCLDLTTDQVKNIVLWYALFEPVFFAMVAPIRSHNIHCVPLDQTHLSGKYKKTLAFMVEGWSKYTALNILPLSTQGTIEFRHMEGHDDVVKFEWWLKTLENLWTFGQNNNINKAALTPDSVLKSFDYIFKDAPIKNIRSSVLGLVSDSLIDVKLALV